MKPVIKFLSDLADNVFMTAEEIAAKLNASGLDDAKKLAIASQDSKEFNKILSDKEIKKIKERVNGIRAAVQPV